jgi:hypothetical protein
MDALQEGRVTTVEAMEEQREQDPAVKRRRTIEETAAELSSQRKDVFEAAVTKLQGMDRQMAAEAARLSLGSCCDSRIAELLESFGWTPVSREDRLLFHAAKGEVTGLVQEGEDAIDDLLQLAKSERSAVSSTAISALGQIGGKRVVAALVELLDSLSTEIEAAEALKQLRDPSAVQPLLHLARRRADSDSGNFRVAIEALGEIGDPTSVAPLLELLVDECGEPTRYEQKPCRADLVFAAVKSIVLKSMFRLSDADLRWLSTLKDQELRLYVGLDQDDTEYYCDHKIDCESLRRLASLEIERRRRAAARP